MKIYKFGLGIKGLDTLDLGGARYARLGPAYDNIDRRAAALTRKANRLLVPVGEPKANVGVLAARVAAQREIDVYSRVNLTRVQFSGNPKPLLDAGTFNYALPWTYVFARTV
jgi:hypothetical protein